MSEAPPGAVVYLDYAASTPVDAAVAAAMAACLAEPGLAANPDATGHAPGQRAAALIASARADVAALINADPGEIVFTSGATESSNLALLGTARFRADRGRHLVSSLAEHRAVLEPLRQLEREGWQLTWLTPRADGAIDPAAVAAAIRPDTVLVSLMHANNETGAVTDIGAVGAICRARDVLLHVDAAQSAARLPLDVVAQCIDLLSLSAHKLYGPKGIGALFVSRTRPGRITPLLYGGGQERGLRPGTLPTHQVLGFGLACRLARGRRDGDRQQELSLRARLKAALAPLPGVRCHGDDATTAGHVLSVSVADVAGESLFAALPELAVAGGAACATASGEPSYVLRLLGLSAGEAEATLRFSVGRGTTMDEVDRAAALVTAAILRLRDQSPATGEPVPAARPGDRVLAGAAGSAARGTWVKAAAAVGEGVVADLALRIHGGPHVTRAGDLLRERLAGAPVADLGRQEARALAGELALPPERTGDLLILIDALRNCLADWENGGLRADPQGVQAWPSP